MIIFSFETPLGINLNAKGLEIISSNLLTSKSPKLGFILVSARYSYSAHGYPSVCSKKLTSKEEPQGNTSNYTSHSKEYVLDY